ncbi:hypothetical protein F2Q70_00015647 [Brassica cretica]|uniref:Uncharacterized protein n=1 Tax=Brassica cretica TaxID=69181 RepID=A0A8S9HQK8_BRACR|nr:hypothetical protein F2Q70_00015647 [Brassica cretica]
MAFPQPELFGLCWKSGYHPKNGEQAKRTYISVARSVADRDPLQLWCEPPEHQRRPCGVQLPLHRPLIEKASRRLTNHQISEADWRFAAQRSNSFSDNQTSNLMPMKRECRRGGGGSLNRTTKGTEPGSSFQSRIMRKKGER